MSLDDLLPDDPEDAEIPHYRMIAEDAYLNQTNANTRAHIANHSERFAEEFGKYVDTSDLAAIDAAWMGWAMAIHTLGWHIPLDMAQDLPPEHTRMHIARAMRYSGAVMLALCNDLPPHPDDKEQP